jgi:electron transport complex protein RnfD
LPEGVSYSIIIMNILVPLIENITLPKPFGTPKKEKEAEKA